MMRKRAVVGFRIIFVAVIVYTVYKAITIKIFPTILNVKHNLTIVERLSTSIQDFQKIENSADELSYAYSAFYEKHSWIGEHNNQSTIVVIGGLKETFNKPLFCIYYSTDLMLKSKIVQASLMQLKDDNSYWRFPYIPYYIFCNLTDVSLTNFTQPPVFVSITDSKDEENQPSNLLRIQYKDTSKRYKFVLCTQALYNNFEQPLILAEWIELHRLMGVEKITLYNMTIGPKTSCLIQSYGHFIETLPWSSPYKYYEDMISNAQGIQMHDCLERYKGVSEYLVIVDRDEVILPYPTAGNNYPEMLASVNQKWKSNTSNADKISGYVFKNGFFENSLLSDNLTNPKIDSVNYNPFVDEIARKLQIATRTTRRKQLDPHTIRSKYIILPEKVIELDSHQIFKSSKNAKPIMVDADMGYSYHYRTNTININCPTSDSGCGVVVDNSAKRFVKDVAESLARHLQSKAKHCNIIKNY